MGYLKPRSGEERALIENGQMHGALLHEQLLGDRHSTGRHGGICLMSRTALYNVPISKMHTPWGKATTSHDYCQLPEVEFVSGYVKVLLNIKFTFGSAKLGVGVSLL